MKPLEALEKMKMDMQYHRNSESCYYYPKNERDEYLDTLEKSLKALEIIKEKRVDVLTLLFTITATEYNYHRSCWGHCLSKKEFDLLKEVLL